MILRNEEERVSKGQHSEAQMIGALKQLEARRTAADVATAYAPFGETYASVGTLDPSYTGQTDDTSSYRQDTAGGLYDFPLREYSTQGRWPNPDPLGRSATCPKDPQTQNRYAYVRNNPMTYTDPTGGMMNPNPDPYPGGGGGGCDPDDPLCGGGGFPCYPDDPLCDPCVFEPELCYPGGGGGGFIGTGGGGSPEQLQFPWPALPPGFFGAIGTGSGGSPSRASTCAKMASKLLIKCVAVGSVVNFAAVGICLSASPACGPAWPACAAACGAALLPIEEAVWSGCFTAAVIDFGACMVTGP